MSTNIVVLGGGTGTSTIARGLHRRPNIDVDVIVSVSDGGGSSGRLRRDHAVNPPGDAVKCLRAKSTLDPNLADVLEHRFANGPERGHTVGNLLAAAFEEMYKDPKTALRMMQELFRVQGQVIYVSSVAAKLIADLHDGTVLHGEEVIDESPHSQRSPIRDCYLEDPNAIASYEALEAIRCADVLIFGPGDLYTSTLPVLLPFGVGPAIFQNKDALLVYVMNMMTKRGQTQSFTASNFLRVASRYTGRRFDAVLLHDAERWPFPSDAIEHYAKESEGPVKDDLKGREVIRMDLLSSAVHQQSAADLVKRSLIRHDSNKLAEAILHLIANPPDRRSPKNYSAPPPANVP